ncbi:hypothetical protein [Streptomyces zaomyceticus]|uniref:zinc finger domain-containing protein n=1 Tax=Streptomyces zaomyceticus TaxID=68286 RepID=UPI002E10BAAC|nr:hypothetical protein OG237_20280 [Streptomyces zaomyceticus]
MSDQAHRPTWNIPETAVTRTALGPHEGVYVRKLEAPAPGPTRDLPALAVACPACGSQPRELCTSHSGTRPRRNDVHRARTAAHKEQTR